MFLHYIQHCQPDSPYFDLPSEDQAAADYPATRDPLPDGWTRELNPHWSFHAPRDSRLPTQGWKIHVSTVPDRAEPVLATARAFCEARRIPYKFIRSARILTNRNSKYGDRSSSGKFITVYPRDEQQFTTVLTELGELLDGEPGPYILSDLRWRNGPLYVRYGGFVLRTTTDARGRRIPCIEDPDGRLVPDRRGPGFHPPAWVTLPPCLDEAVAARTAGTGRGLPFTVRRALHFSNGGGVYEATELATGRTVLVKEARPLAGLDAQGTDAVTRLEQERRALKTLAGIQAIPELIDYRRGHEHYYLTRELVDGTALNLGGGTANPWTDGTLDDRNARRYTAWALGILDQIEQTIDAMHDRGVVFGDLHPGNILVRPDGTIAFIDLETATPITAAAPQVIGVPGFRAPHHYRGAALDRYALGCLRMALFAPMTALLDHAPHEPDRLLSLIAARFPVPDDFEQQVRRDLDAGQQTGPTPTRPAPAEPPAPSAAAWPTLRDAITGGILGSATPDRTDRLYPGDIEQFTTSGGGAAFAHGAAGVLWTLAEAGTDIPDAHIRWLDDAAHTMATAAVTPGPRLGFYDGLAGIAFTLQRLGRTDHAHDLLEHVATSRLDHLDHTLAAGRAGIGLTLLHFARTTGDRELLTRARELGDQLAAGITGITDSTGPARPGLLHGHSGTALLLLRLAEDTGDRSLLPAAADALHHDLTELGLTGPGERSAPPRSMPYLGIGSAGPAMIADRLLPHLPDPRLTSALERGRTALTTEFHPRAGLFTGRAGLVLALRQLNRGTPDDTQALRRHLAAFNWHAVHTGRHTEFLGAHFLRRSNDLGTGSAGVLLALDAALGTGGTTLPFLESHH
ncbi:class III lanthionine synthetase LanKC [Kitasatospora sp. MBT63]|uniref:class III lanthionine synthetase LanKC n=1 Tax=Kitasatospora sp. MBT63 TaxID=1444768 RepID=UPI00053976A1|nr:class III lanthionine synthetase LanKC [Kitasatospora sp. MBT63]